MFYSQSIYNFSLHHLLILQISIVYKLYAIHEQQHVSGECMAYLFHQCCVQFTPQHGTITFSQL